MTMRRYKKRLSITWRLSTTQRQRRGSKSSKNCMPICWMEVNRHILTLTRLTMCWWEKKALKFLVSVTYAQKSHPFSKLSKRAQPILSNLFTLCFSKRATFWKSKSRMSFEDYKSLITRPWIWAHIIRISANNQSSNSIMLSIFLCSWESNAKTYPWSNFSRLMTGMADQLHHPKI